MEQKVDAPEGKKNKTGLIIGIVIAAIVAVAVALIVVLCVNSGNKAENGGDGAGASLEIGESDSDAKKWVGSDEYGYVEVPESWSTILDSDEGLQYGSSKTDVSKGYYISMLVRPTSEIDAESWAEGMKMVFEEEDVSDIEVATKKIGKNTAHVVSGYYKEYSRWLATYTMDTEDGKTHYVSIEGPDRANAAFKIPETFRLTK